MTKIDYIGRQSIALNISHKFRVKFVLFLFLKEYMFHILLKNLIITSQLMRSLLAWSRGLACSRCYFA